MKSLITIVGPSGVGKTTLLNALRAKYKFAIAYEQHKERPFQVLFKQDAKYALANQLDYLLFRAEQERLLRLESKPALMDGGFDLDFYGFTRLFHSRGWLSDPEFDLCRRLHTLTRQLLPPPDLIIALSGNANVDFDIPTTQLSESGSNIDFNGDGDKSDSFNSSISGLVYCTEDVVLEGSSWTFNGSLLAKDVQITDSVVIGAPA